jgi:hypothetical protein
MLDDADLEAAIAEGIISADQVEKLRAFAGSRRLAADRADDERFHFMRGFNDFFFAVGIVLLGAGIAFFAGGDPRMNLIAAALIWALSEFLVRRMRLVLPGILLVCLFAYFVFWMTSLDFAPLAHWAGLPLQAHPDVSAIHRPFIDQLTPRAIAAKALVAAVATAIFYLRFRLPFALLVVAGSLVLFVATALGPLLFPGPAAYALILLLCGFAVFAAAMTYDLSDRTRATRYADCGFWLHLLAAPLIVHSLIRLVIPGTTGPFAVSMTTTSAIAIFVIVAALTAIAIVIDRRALLVSALIYLGVAIGYALTGAIRAGAGNEPVVFFATLVILGAMVLALGVGWQPLRRQFLRIFPPGLVGRLPPAAYPV